MIRLLLAFLLLVPAPASMAQPARPPAPLPAAPTPPAPVPNEPQRTTSTFADWTLRCDRPENGPHVCEVAQTLYDQAQVVSQTAIGRTNRAEQLRLTILVPVNVTLASAPRLTAGENEPSVPPLQLTWRRCIQAGCLADTLLTEDILRRLRARTEPSRILFQDSAGREVALPFSPRGLPQALDALAKEEVR